MKTAIYLGLIFSLFWSSPAKAQKNKYIDSAYSDPPISIDLGSFTIDEDAFNLNPQSKNYALLIGVNDYRDENISTLEHPVDNAVKLREILSTYYTFETQDIILLPNPERRRIIKELDNLARRIRSHDNLLIFYSGHGIFDEKTAIGYWLPTDAQKEDRSNWISNNTIREQIEGINAFHTLVISDACFSGSILRDIERLDVRVMNDTKSRTALTSGAYSRVPDDSFFFIYLVDYMKKNLESHLMAREIYREINQDVINRSKGKQIPQYGIIPNTDDRGGDFIFVRKR